MSPLLVENPWPAITVGAIAELILAIFLLRTGNGRLLWSMGAVLVGVVALVILERAVVTEREQVEQTLEAICAALERNNPAEVLAFIAPTATQIRSLAERNMKRFIFEEVKLTGDLVVRFEQVTPPRAVASFIGRANVRDRKGQAIYDHMIQRAQVTLEKSGDRWLVTGFELKELREPRPPGKKEQPIVPTP